MHCGQEIVPLTADAVPVGQLVHTVRPGSDTNLPAPQSEQTLWPLWLWTEPGAQGRQPRADDELEKEPAGHGVQTARPGRLLNSPGLHGTQAVWPGWP